MKTADIRAAYLDFFAQRGHRQVPSSGLVPLNDPTLLFTNSGMVQFKDALMGREDLGYTRATSAQRCVRAGGKHNDLENVGYTARHHTFFEMLGNFSFGDYFKEDTIEWAWAFITEVLKLPPERLWVTVHPEDKASYDIWVNKIGFNPERITALEENFWAMGDTGPCGRNTEIFYDHGPEVAGGPPGTPEEDGDRYVEFWNLVFPEFDRSPDGTLTPLARPGVDTGMGLERMAAIMQGVHSNYEIDIFQNLMRAAGARAGITDPAEIAANPSLRVIADHIRSCAFLVADGVIPSNEDRGYVLRRIIRRALRHGYKLGISEPFFDTLVEPLAQEMGEAYPILRERQAQVTATLRREETRFRETLSQGMELLEKTIAGLGDKTIPGDVAFKLYDTYGFPVDLTQDVARERGLNVDMVGFDRAMDAQRERARAASRFDAGMVTRIHVDRAVDFSGYDRLEDEAEIIALYRQGETELQAVDQLDAEESGVVVLDRTPFYAEGGGQVGDRGEILAGEACFAVRDTVPGGRQHLHQGSVRQGSLRVGAKARACVDVEKRRRTALNHSATHLMHAALRSVLGPGVQQKGSLVDETRLRFDFSHDAPLSTDEIARIETLVNQEIQRNTPVQVDHMAYDAAVGKGAIALFGEKYGDEVRVLTMGNGYSVELCGGTHVSRTGDIGLFRIQSESGIAAGVRRIEALTGPGALAWLNESEQLLEAAAERLGASRQDVLDRLSQVLAQNRELKKQLEQVQAKGRCAQGADLAAQAVTLADGTRFLAARLEAEDPKALLGTLDALKSKLGDAVIVLGQVSEGRVNLVAGVSKSLSSRVKAGDLIQAVAPVVGARGGGRPDMARAGGGDKPEALAQALEQAQAWVVAQLD
jgi:alanyl-tRNA synthetase